MKLLHIRINLKSPPVLGGTIYKKLLKPVYQIIKKHSEINNFEEEPQNQKQEIKNLKPTTDNRPLRLRSGTGRTDNRHQFFIYLIKDCTMTTIHIEEELNLDKTHFKTMEEFQLYLLMREKEQPTDYSLSEAHKKIIDERVKEADEAKEPGLSWESVKANLQKGNE